MPEGLKLDELEQYRQEKLNAEREGRPCKYKNPREVYAADPNRDTYLVERDEDEISAEQEQLDRIKEGDVTPSRFLADPGQEVAEALALEDVAHIPTHQNAMPTPNPVDGITSAVDSDDENPDVDIPGQTRDFTDEEKRESALPGPDTDSPNHPTPVGAVTTENSGHEEELEGTVKPQDENPSVEIPNETQKDETPQPDENPSVEIPNETQVGKEPRPDLDTI